MVDSTAPWDGDGIVLSEHSIHWVVATAGARTAAESERLYSESGPGNVWSLEARRVHRPSTASAGAGDRRLLGGWGWPGTGWPAESHHYSSTWDQLRAAPGLVCMWPLLPPYYTYRPGVTCDQGRLRHKTWQGLRDTTWGVTVIGECQEQCFYHLLHNKVNATFPLYSEWALGQGS